MHKINRVRLELISLGFTRQYDSRNRITRTTPEGETHTYRYTHNQLTHIQLPEEGSITWNRPAQITLPGGIVQHTQYDPLMRPRQIKSQQQNHSPILQRDIQDREAACHSLPFNRRRTAGTWRRLTASLSSISANITCTPPSRFFSSPEMTAERTSTLR